MNNPLLIIEREANRNSDPSQALRILLPLYQHIDDLCEDHHTLGQMRAQYDNGQNASFHQPMPHWKQEALQMSQRRLPRYFFRLYSHASGGGECGLNCKCAIRPHAAINIDESMHRTIYDMPEGILRNMIDNHLDQFDDPGTEFTSWGASLHACFEAGNDGAGACIAIVDTKKLNAHQAHNPPQVYHTPQLWRAGLSSEPYHGEYLIHGEIKGRGSDLLSLPFEGEHAANIKQFTRYNSARPSFVEINFSCIADEMMYALELAKPIFESSMNHAMPGSDCGSLIYTVAMFLGMRYRNQPAIFETLIPNVVNTIFSVEQIRGYKNWKTLKKEWSQDESIMSDVVYISFYKEIRLAILVLRYIAAM